MTEKQIIRVADVMVQDYALVEGVVTVAEALAILQEKSMHFLIVAKRSQDDEFGIVTVADIAKQVLARNRSPERTNVYEIMFKPVLSVRPSMDIRYCVRLFERFGISAAPVVDGDQIQGIVSYDMLVLKGLARQNCPRVQAGRRRLVRPAQRPVGPTYTVEGHPAKRGDVDQAFVSARAASRRAIGPACGLLPRSDDFRRSATRVRVVHATPHLGRGLSYPVAHELQ